MVKHTFYLPVAICNRIVERKYQSALVLMALGITALGNLSRHHLK